MYRTCFSCGDWIVLDWMGLCSEQPFSQQKVNISVSGSTMRMNEPQLNGISFEIEKKEVFSIQIGIRIRITIQLLIQFESRRQIRSELS